MALFHEHTGRLRTWARRTIWFYLIVGILCAIVIPIFMIYRKEGADARSAVDVEPQGVSHTGDFIHVVATVSSVDFQDKNFRVHFEFTPHGTLAGDDGILTEAIEIALFYTTLSFPEGQIMRSVDVTMPYTRGAPIDYPFDRYVSYFEILIHKEKEKLHKIPVSFTFLAMLQTVEFVPVLHLDPTDTYKIAMQITTNRSPTTIGFSVFIVVIMWALSISIGIITIQVVRKHRESDEHILTLGITTLFALPALRETQPGIPAIGCAADVLGFYWNMAIIAISSICVLLASALRWKEPTIKRELELLRLEHDNQSRLIKEMTVPMPFPLTGGPFTDRQFRKKRVPFIMTRHPPPSTPEKPSPLPSFTIEKAKHDHQETTPKNDHENDHWSFSDDDDDDLISLQRIHRASGAALNSKNHSGSNIISQDDAETRVREKPSIGRPSHEQPPSNSLLLPSDHLSPPPSTVQPSRTPPKSTNASPSADGECSCALLPVVSTENDTHTSESSWPTTPNSESSTSSPSIVDPDIPATVPSHTHATTSSASAITGLHKVTESLRVHSPPTISSPYQYPQWNESTPNLLPPTSTDLSNSRLPVHMSNYQYHRYRHLHRNHRPTQSSQSLPVQHIPVQPTSSPIVTTPSSPIITSTRMATAAAPLHQINSTRKQPTSAGCSPKSSQKGSISRLTTRLLPTGSRPIAKNVVSPLRETTTTTTATATTPTSPKEPMSKGIVRAKSAAAITSSATSASRPTVFGGQGGRVRLTDVKQHAIHRGGGDIGPSTIADSSSVKTEGFIEGEKLGGLDER